MRNVFKILKILSFLIIIQTLIVMIAGAYVSATGAGLGCPDWPLCYGEAVPDLSEQFTLIEFTHRVLAGTLGLLLITLVSITWFNYFRYREVHDDVLGYYLKKIGMLLLVALSILSVQILLGGMTVLTQLPPELVAVHLGTATVFFGMMIFITREIWHVSDYHSPPPTAQHPDLTTEKEESMMDKHTSPSTGRVHSSITNSIP